MSNKLIIISRDGKCINDFIVEHNIDKANVAIVKSVKDLTASIAEGSVRYVIISPLPFCYQWAIRPLLKPLTNVTKHYNKKLINF